MLKNLQQSPVAFQVKSSIQCLHNLASPICLVYCLLLSRVAPFLTAPPSYVMGGAQTLNHESDIYRFPTSEFSYLWNTYLIIPGWLWGLDTMNVKGLAWCKEHNRCIINRTHCGCYYHSCLCAYVHDIPHGGNACPSYCSSLTVPKGQIPFLFFLLFILKIEYSWLMIL